MRQGRRRSKTPRLTENAARLWPRSVFRSQLLLEAGMRTRRCLSAASPIQRLRESRGSAAGSRFVRPLLFRVSAPLAKRVVRIRPWGFETSTGKCQLGR